MKTLRLSFIFFIACVLPLSGWAQLTRVANTTIDLGGAAVDPVPDIDGTLAGDESDYGAALATQDTQTTFGDNNLASAALSNGSELDVAYGVVGNGNLNLLLTGNLENDPNPFQKLFIFFDTQSGGQNRLLGNSGQGSVDRLGDSNGDGSAGNGLTFDAGFDADFALLVNGDSLSTFVDFIDLTSLSSTFVGSFAPGTAADLSLGIRAAQDQSNTAGVTAGSGADSGTGVVTGLEIRIPLSLLNNPGGDIDVSAFIGNANADFLANQVLAPLGPSGSLGEPRNVDFGSIGGNQFFTVPNSNAVTFTYSGTNAFPGLSFTDPVGLVCAPGDTNRLFVIERAGRIQVITNLAAPTKTLFMDIDARVTGGESGNDERGLLGMAFHPDYNGTNPYFYVFMTADDSTSQGGGLHNVLSRYTIDPGNANSGLSTSEVIFIRQKDDAGNHNGGDVHFGPDGYLYVSLGDEGNGNDTLNNSQLIDKDYFSGIIRIDVDKKPGNIGPNPHPANEGSVTNYAVPFDNPFIGFTQFNGIAVNSNNVITEFYAVGLRNPFRMAFDEANGLLYCGDVGQGAREEVDIIVAGGNYGWKWREGFIATPGIGSPPAGFTNAIDPILDYPRGGGDFEGFVITGGRVYRGDLYPELLGRYIFTDFASGNIWSLFYDGTNATEWAKLYDDPNISAFGKDPRNGDILMCDLNEDIIKRLVRTTSGGPNILPQTLADTGIFSDLSNLTPEAGVVPYDIIVPLWSDGAGKTRWFSIPDTNHTMSFTSEDQWDFPTTGMVWVKHFELELTNGVPSSAQRLETRVLSYQDNGEVVGFTYRWGQSTTNAILVPADGLDEAFIVDVGGVLTTQIWEYPSRSECLACHVPGAGGPLGFNSPQLNRDHVYGAVTQNQIQAFSDAGYFDAPIPSPHTLRALADGNDTNYSLEYRARSYFQANCRQCHFPGGVNEDWDARIITSLSQTHLINNQVIPGDPGSSILPARMSSLSGNRMPPLASSIVDTQAVALVNAWINDIAGYQTFAEWQVFHFGSTNAPDAQANADPDGDGGRNDLEWLTGTNPTNAVADAWSIDIDMNGSSVDILYDHLANRGFEVEYTTDLINPTWLPVNDTDNGPFFSASDFMNSITDVDPTSTSRYYRIRVYEP